MNKKYNEIKINYDSKFNGRKGIYWIFNEEFKIFRLFRNDEGFILDIRVWLLLRLISLFFYIFNN